MNKYLTIFKISFAQEFAYKINFIMWRVRNVLQVFLIFFLWDTVFTDSSRQVFGYDRAKILTYIFGLLLVKAFVLSSRSIDIPGEISSGKLANYLIKPISYFKYWLVRDFSSKSLNLIFAGVEFGLLYLLLKPPIFFQRDILLFFLFLLSLGLAIILYFLLLLLFGMLAIWYPEQGWGPIFLLIILVDFLAGGIFPIDIFPAGISNILYLTPFPYLLFVPIQIYLGKFSSVFIFKSILMALFWIGVIWVVVKRTWNLGLKLYRSEGR